MDVKHYMNIKSSKDLRNQLKKDLVKTKYDPKARNGDKTWSVSEMVENDDRAVLFGIMLLMGTDERGRKLGAGNGINRADKKNLFRLQLMTRQACDMDAQGNRLVKNPCEVGHQSEVLNCVKFEDKPLPGDIVRIKGDRFDNDPMTGKKLTSRAVRDAAQQQGRDLFAYDTYEVDEDGCIDVEFEHCLELLTKWGHRIAGPQFQRLNTNKKDERGNLDKAQIKITNWRFKEVADDFSIGEKPGRASGNDRPTPPPVPNKK
jgi:hypothetical protein